jgi:hypothetical protein
LDSYLTQAHVTVRKYEKLKEKWTDDFIKQCNVDQLIRNYPVEFQCVALNIIQTRRQARARQSQPPWWIVATGNSLPCAGCGTYFPGKPPVFVNNVSVRGMLMIVLVLVVEEKLEWIGQDTVMHVEIMNDLDPYGLPNHKEQLLYMIRDTIRILITQPK